MEGVDSRLYGEGVKGSFWPSTAAGDQPLRRSLPDACVFPIHGLGFSRRRAKTAPRPPNAVAASSRNVGAIGASKHNATEGPRMVEHCLRSVLRSRVRPVFSQWRHPQDRLRLRRNSAFLCRWTLNNTKSRAAGCARAGVRCARVLQRHWADASWRRVPATRSP